MQHNPFEQAADAGELVADVVAALHAAGDTPVLNAHDGTEIAGWVTELAKALAEDRAQPGELVGVADGEPVGTLAGCLAAWLVGATPLVGAPGSPARLEVHAAHREVTAHDTPVSSVAAALVVAAELVGSVAHPLAGLGRLEPPAGAGVQVLADWRVDAWLPLVVRALLAGRRVRLRAESGIPDPDPDTVLACSISRLANDSTLADAPFAGWLSWGGGCLAEPLPGGPHHHGFGDHFVVAEVAHPATGGERLVRGRVHGRHRVCNPAGRPLPANAWGHLALAGRLPVIAATPAELADQDLGERTWASDYRARGRADGTVEFDLRDLDHLRFAGRRIAPALAARLLAGAGLPDAALLARDPDTDRARIVLYATGTVDPTVRTRLVAALPTWAGPLGVATLHTLPRDPDGAVDLAAVAAVVPPDDWLLARTARALSGEDIPVRLRTLSTPVAATALPMPPDFTAGGGHYPDTRPALMDGPAMTPPTDDLLDRLCRAAETDRGLLLVDDTGAERFLGYRELRTDAARIATHLRATGVRPGDELIVHCARPADLFAGIWGCAMVGALPVPLTPAAQYEAAGNPLWHLLGPDTMLTRRALLTTGPQRDLTGAALQRRGLAAEMFLIEDARAREPLPRREWTPRPHALMLLTSGSTGAPKGVALSHRNLVALGQAIGREFQLDDEVSINWLAVDHVGGLVQHHVRDLVLANTQIHVDTGYVLARPTRLLDLCDRHRVTITWMANFGFNLINEQADEIAAGSWDLSPIKVWENGGEPVTHEGNQQFLALLAPHGLRPDVIKPVFGMTETSSAIIVAHNLVRGRQDYVHWLSDTALDRPVVCALPGDGSPFVEVGGPCAGVSMRVVDAEGRVCPEGVSGRIEVSGLQIMDGYYRNDKANAETFTEDGWLRMGDCGFMVDGSLVVTGREKDVIIVNGLNYAARAMENTIEAVPGVRQGCCAAVSVRPAGSVTDDLLVLYSSAADQVADPAAIEAALIAEFNLRPVAIVELEPDQWPRTAIGKIRRQPLAQAFLAGEFADRIALRRGSDLGDAATLPAWHFVPRWRPAALPPTPAPTALWLGESAPAAATLVATAGEPFTGFDADGRARYRPGNAEDLDALLAAALDRAGRLDTVIDATRRRVPDTDDAAAAVRALTAAGVEWEALCRAAGGMATPPAVVFATTAAFAVTGDEPGIANAALPGLAQSLGQSHPRLSVTVVDGATPDALLAEHASADTQVVHRDGVRSVLGLEPLPTDEVSRAPQRVLREGGAYLVIGGLGGIGAHLCQHLLRQFRATLLVVGRGPAADGDPRAQTLAYLSDRAADHGGEIRYRALDATDPAALRAAVEQAERAWGRSVDAVFNLAGEGSVLAQLDALTRQEQADPAASVRRAASRITLCHTIDAVLGDRPVVSFGSVNGLFGGAGFAEYAGACAYQAAHATRSAARGDVCLDWSMWQQIGMAAGAPATLVELANRRGFDRLTPPQGLASLHVALDASAPRVLIGLSPAGSAMAPLLPFDGIEYLVEADGVDEPAEVAELLGVPAARVRCVRTRTTATTATTANSAVSAPHTEALLAVFRDVLARPELDAEDNFFASGGDSIRAIQVVSRAAESGIRFSPLDLFEHKSVAALLTHLTRHDRLDDIPDQGTDRDTTAPVAVPPIFTWWLEVAGDQAARDHLTMSMQYEVDSALAPAVVEAALLALIERHEALRLRLVDTPTGWQLTTEQEPGKSLVFDSHTVPAGADVAELAAAVERPMHRGLDPSAGPVVRAAHLLVDDRATARLILVVHHAAVDGVSWRILEDDLRALLEAGRDAAAPAAPAAPAALPPATLGFLDWAHRVSGLARQVDGSAMADAWLARLDRPVGVLPGAPPARPREADTRILSRSVPAAELGRLADASVNELLLTAVGWSLGEWTGAESVAIDVEGHGRLQRDLPADLSRSLGWFTAIAPLCLDVRGSAGEALARVRRAVADLRGRDLEWGLLRYLDACPPDHPLRALPERQVSYNYLGVFDGGGERTGAVLSAVPGSLGAEQGPSTARHYLIDVAAQVSDGNVELSVKYSPALHPTADIERWLDRIQSTIGALLAGDGPADVEHDELLLALAEVDLGAEDIAEDIAEEVA